MAIVIREADDELGVEEKLVALKILLVIYLHDKRCFDALADVEELLNDSKMDKHKEYLLLRQREVRQVLERSLNEKRASFLQRIIAFLNYSDDCC